MEKSGGGVGISSEIYQDNRRREKYPMILCSFLCFYSARTFLHHHHHLIPISIPLHDFRIFFLFLFDFIFPFFFFVLLSMTLVFSHIFFFYFSFFLFFFGRKYCNVNKEDKVEKHQGREYGRLTSKLFHRSPF